MITPAEALTVEPNDRERRELRRLFDARYAELCRFARRYVHSDAAAVDVVQEVFARLWERRDRRPLSDIRPAYLYRAVRNRALNRIEKAESRDEALQSLSPVASGRIPGPDDRLQSERLRRRVEAAIEALPPRCREIFLLVRRDGLTYSETADALDLSESTVDTQMGRALSRLREELADLL